MFLNFKNVVASPRRKLPFGIAQVGKSFRNEITPGNFVFRTLEFEQMEMEYFVPPDDAQRWHEHWLAERLRLVHDACGIDADHLRLRAARRRRALRTTRARRATSSTSSPGLVRARGHRQPHRLRPHPARQVQRQERSTYFDQETGERYVPHVIEPAAGVGRTVLAVLLSTPTTRTTSAASSGPCCKLHPRLAPIKVAVLPLVRKDGQPELAREVFDALRGQLQAEYDEARSIGRRYRRQDEIGTPYCVTIDHQSLQDRTVTVRERDSLKQERIAIDELPALLGGRLATPWRSPKLDD